MNAAQLLTELTRLGVRIEAHGERLRYSPRSAVTPDLAKRMKAHKGELMTMAREAADEQFEERAAIMEYDGGLSRTDAEYFARILTMKVIDS
jgi:hypothetical protein